jgi:alpha,alpha-trehalase
LYFTETWLTEAFGSENLEKHQKYKVAAQERKTAINRYLWSDSLEFYTDYWFKQKKQSNVLSLAALWPLYFGMASQNRAKGVAQQVESKFLKSGGLITTQLNTGEQWDCPNGWAPLHWVSIQGLKQYGFDDLASEISTKWLATVTQFFNATGKLMEKYNVVSVDDIAQGGEYDVQEGFGWTNGVTQALLNQQIEH